MSNTAQFALPLILPSQAQKHVTVNEALAILDCVAQLRLQSVATSQPPAINVDGEAYAVPVGATGDWAGQDGKIAIFSNGGWQYLAPRMGWQAFNEETGTNQLFDGTAWLDSTLAATPSGAATSVEIVEIDHVIAPGATSTTVPVLPGPSQVIGVTGRVTTGITGTLSGWQLGTAGSVNRYGSGLGLALNSYALGLTGTPISYYSDEALVLTAENGTFAGGEVRLAVHFMTLVPPRPV